MNLNLNKPLVFFDLETTGINIIKDRIIEISMLKIFPNKKKEIKTYQINPQIPIPKEATEIHGITDIDIKKAPSFNKLAPTILSFLKDCDLAGYNSNRFDVPLLIEEFDRYGFDLDISNIKTVDIQNIFHKMEQRTLVAAYKFYCNKNLNDAHSAKADTIATYEILLSQLEKYNELEPSIDFLSKFSKNNKNLDLVGRMILNEKNEAIFNFGKYKGKIVAKVLKKDPSYYNWIMKNEFPKDTKKKLKQIKENNS